MKQAPMAPPVLSTSIRRRPLSQFEAAAKGVSTQSSKADAAVRNGVRGIALAGEVDAPAMEVVGLFPYQSYFDSTRLQQALLPQAPNDSIVQSTLDEQQVAGYGIGLHPSSETPVAISFDTGASQGATPAYRLKPGEVIRPFGRPRGRGHNAQFSGFRWGLPFGWLGGGSATLVVLRTADAEVDWQAIESEVVFHRVRMAVLTGPDLTSATIIRENWPTRFPWPSAQITSSGITNITQRGQPALAPTPTRTLMSLYQPTGDLLTSTMNIYVCGSDFFAQRSLTAPTTADNTIIQQFTYTWDPYTALVGAAAPFDAARVCDFMPEAAQRMGCNYASCGVVLASNDATLAGAYVDFTRLGKL